jgi:hypothetical protein
MTADIKINWIENYDQGIEKARDEKKPVMHYFFNDG